MISHTLTIDSVVFESRGKSILSDIYLHCVTGKTTALIGKNGSGKSCLMNIIAQQIHPLSKSIRIDNRPIGSIYPHITYLPQYLFIPGHLNIRKVFKDIHIATGPFMEQFPAFTRKINTPLKRLSTGERRLVEVYAIIKAPCIFSLLDEPFTQIMPVHQERMIHLLKEETTKGFLIADHLYQQLLPISSYCYLLKEGKSWNIENKEQLKDFGYIQHF